jgi:hypothetical protein
VGRLAGYQAVHDVDDPAYGASPDRITN